MTDDNECSSTTPFPNAAHHPTIIATPISTTMKKQSSSPSNANDDDDSLDRRTSSPRSPLDCDIGDVLGSSSSSKVPPPPPPPTETAEERCSSSSDKNCMKALQQQKQVPLPSLLQVVPGSCCPPPPPTVHALVDSLQTPAAIRSSDTTPPHTPSSRNRRKKNTSQKKNKSVSFSKRIQFREVRHLHDFAQEEIADLWMTAQDYIFIKAVVRATVILMMKGYCLSKDEEENDFCYRGLEYRTKMGARRRNENKISCKSAVLNEQDMQHEEDFFDIEHIKMVSEEASQECRDNARSTAIEDEKSIQDYLQDIREEVLYTQLLTNKCPKSSFGVRSQSQQKQEQANTGYFL